MEKPKQQHSKQVQRQQQEQSEHGSAYEQDHHIEGNEVGIINFISIGYPGQIWHFCVKIATLLV